MALRAPPAGLLWLVVAIVAATWCRGALWGGVAGGAEDVSAVWVTVPPEHSARLAGVIVETQHAACVNVLPAVSSVYRWNGGVTHDTEDLLMIKTRTDRVAALTALVKQHHPYTVPEIIAVRLSQGSDDYLEWIRQNALPLPAA